MPLSAGERLGPYEIIGLIGKGGMGEVYRARDPRLGRDVAIKVSVERFTERFDREARVIASLNHPNVSTLHDVGPNYLVMELVDGETLAERIQRGALPLDEALAIARQLVEALEAAHEKGITHRDLKPGNIKIKPDGTVKVLDFGLAKTGGVPAMPSDNSPTAVMSQTEAGIILGTAAYMSPEQAKGKPVDKRADIWAFGVVLYEMLTGRQLFSGETTTEVLAAVIEREPQWNHVPPETRTLLRRCLHKDPRRRLRDIGDALPLLEEQPKPVAQTRPLAWIGIAAALLLALLGLSLVHFRESPPDVQAARLVIPIPDGFLFNESTAATISPDGRYIAFPSVGADGVPRMWIRRLDALEVRPIEGSEGVSAANSPPFWSFDSRFIAYNAGGKLKINALAGGPPQTVSNITGGAPGGTWNRDNLIVYGSQTGGLMRVVAAPGEKPTPLTVLAAGETAHRSPQFLPDQRHVLYHRASSNPETTGVYVGSIDVKPEEQNVKPLLLSDRQAQYVPSATGGSGWLLFLREGSLMAQSFDPVSLKLSGDPTPIAAAVGSFPGTNYGLFSASENGLLVYRTASNDMMQLTWVDSQGKVIGTLGDPGQYAHPAISPNGTRVAISRTDSQGNQDIWIYDVVSENPLRLTFDAAADSAPVWSDDTHIVFRSNRRGRFDLYTRAVDGSGDDQLLWKSDEDKIPYGYSPDGRFLLFGSTSPKTQPDIWVLQVDGDPKAVPLMNEATTELHAQFSRDGRFFAYASLESGELQILVRPFRPFSDPTGNSETGGKWMVSRGGSVYPRWRGKQLLYMTGAGEIMAADVNTDKMFDFESPKRLFTAPVGPSPIIGGGDISADGQRFLFVAPHASSNAQSPFIVILNWEAALKK